ncbi:MAG: hypothetical protein AVDCRST_MAG85-2421 [uncultured Solirubrobacteraceae bacterium]|uniref:HpcH/HpaI aldolase/citrate lyase domain-containing protein n=1 Tax=uncultured Solirubrobacteraceae bacterium TaxID=1162706 RepID=A0A6J4T2U2_9ACTN|nr:MAG: hypothetical protein AVDCRST_MAG85-2421 [uncultured Solirubrobacteraceae bacterium]
MLVLLERLIDDAGLFPPARKAMVAAVADHRAARAGEHAWLLGRLLCPVSRLDELVAAGPDPDWRLGAVVDAADWRAAFAAVAAYDGPGTIDAIELKLPGEPVATVLDEAPEGIDVFVEVPVADTRAMTTALEDLAADGRAGAKIRCGGVTADAFPSDASVAAFVTQCARLGLRFKATAGLHHPFRTRDEAIGVLQHGFVNLLAAAALPGADADAIIAGTDPSAFTLTDSTIGWGANAGDAAEARARFTGQGSCSFSEPVDDLIEHGILPAAAGARA